MQMKKFINDPENLTAELLEGLALANPDILELGEDNMVINKKLAEADRVTIVTQGGSGHEPAIEGFVGEGMVDIDVVGDIFAAPGPQACVDAIKLADKGKGVLYIVLNHAGDMLTGNMTMKQCKKQGLNVVKVVTQEDVSNAPRENADDRRGLVGCIPTYKIAGAAAAEGRSLEEVAAVAATRFSTIALIASVIAVFWSIVTSSTACSRNSSIFLATSTACSLSRTTIGSKTPWFDGSELSSVTKLKFSICFLRSG